MLRGESGQPESDRPGKRTKTVLLEAPIHVLSVQPLSPGRPDKARSARASARRRAARSPAATPAPAGDSALKLSAPGMLVPGTTYHDAAEQAVDSVGTDDAESGVQRVGHF